MAIGSSLNIVEEPLYDPVAPRWIAVGTVEANVTAAARQRGREIRARSPIIGLVERTGYPRIVERRHDQGRHANGRHEGDGPAAFVIILGAGEAMARCNEGVVVVPN